MQARAHENLRGFAPLVDGVAIWVGMELLTEHNGQAYWSKYDGRTTGGEYRIVYSGTTRRHGRPRKEVAVMSTPREVSERCSLGPKLRWRLQRAVRDHHRVGLLAAAASADRSRDAAVREAAVAAAADPPPPLLQQRTATIMPTGIADLVLWELYSGPWRSMARAATDWSSVYSMTIDWEPAFRADKTADLARWSPWAFVLREYSFHGGALCRVPHHVHLSFDCRTLGLAQAGVHRSRVDAFGQGAHTVHAVFSDVQLRVWSTFILQCSQEGLPTTFSIEQPRGSHAYRHPDLAALIDSGLLVVVNVDYCRYGAVAQKPSAFAVSSVLAKWSSGEGAKAAAGATRTPIWARRCRGSHGCRAVNLSVRRTGDTVSVPLALHGGPAVLRLLDSRIPPALCHEVTRMWTGYHAAQRQQATKEQGTVAGLGRGCYGVITADTARQLLFFWCTAPRFPRGRPILQCAALRAASLQGSRLPPLEGDSGTRAMAWHAAQIAQAAAKAARRSATPPAGSRARHRTSLAVAAAPRGSGSGHGGSPASPAPRRRPRKSARPKRRRLEPPPAASAGDAEHPIVIDDGAAPCRDAPSTTLGCCDVDGCSRRATSVIQATPLCGQCGGLATGWAV